LRVYQRKDTYDKGSTFVTVSSLLCVFYRTGHLRVSFSDCYIPKIAFGRTRGSACVTTPCRTWQ